MPSPGTDPNPNPAPAANPTAAANPAPAANPTPAAASAADPAKPETFTAAQVEELKKQAASEAKEEAKKEAAEAAKKAAEKAEELSKLSETEKEKKLREEAESELAKYKAQLAESKIADYTRQQLAEAKLPAEALDFVKAADEATTAKRVKAFGEMFAAAVQAGVEARFKTGGQSPKLGTGNTPAAPSAGARKRGVEVMS